MWTYLQNTGELLRPNGRYLAAGYSGSPEGKNDPTKQSIPDEGPIPQGKYDINPPEDTISHGPYVLPLTPHPENEMFGRSGFLIHGERKAGSVGFASEGCIILPLEVREAIWQSGDHQLQVLDGIKWP